VRSGVLAALALGSAIVPAHAGQEVGRPAFHFRAFCTFEREGAQLDLSDAKAAERLLNRHAHAHGWPWEPEGPDFVSGTAVARCPDLVLGQMAEVRDLRQEDDGVFLYRAIAVALERNGKLEAALELLKRGAEDNVLDESPRSHDMHGSFLSEWASKLAAHSGDWNKALELAEGWHANSTCGNCASSEWSRIRDFKGRCFVESGRYGEAVALARRSAGWSRARSTILIELWLDCELREGRAKTVDDALSNVLSLVPEEAADDCRKARDAWALARAPRATQIERVQELASAHPELAVPLLLSLDEEELSGLLRRLDFSDRSVRDSALASLLAQLGSPLMESELKEISVFSRRYLSDMWQEANIRWKLLTAEN
jgi:hypothetical protein